MRYCHDPRHSNPCPQPCSGCEEECDPQYLKQGEDDEISMNPLRRLIAKLAEDSDDNDITHFGEPADTLTFVIPDGDGGNLVLAVMPDGLIADRQDANGDVVATWAATYMELLDLTH